MLKKIIVNFVSLLMNNGINVLLSLILIPFYISHYGFDNYGILSLTQVISTYVMITCDYHFAAIASREISVNRNNNKFISNYISEVLSVKIVLFLISIIVITALVICIPNYRLLLFDFYFGAFLGLSVSLFPTFVFQGIENLKPVAAINGICKGLGVAFICLYLVNKTDYQWVNITLATANFIGVICAYAWLSNKYKIKFHKISNFTIILNHLKNGFKVFIASFAVSFTVSSNVLILGIFADKNIVGYYSLAEKIVAFIRQLLSTLYQVIYPYVCKEFENKSELLKLFLRKYMVLLIIGTAILVTAVYVFADYLYLINSNKDFTESTIILKLICFMPLIIATNNVYNLYIMAARKENVFANILLLASITYLPLSLFLTEKYSVNGLITSSYLIEIFVLLGLIWMSEIKYKHLKIWRK